MSSQNTIYETIGGEKTLEELVDHFYAQVLLDPELYPYFRSSDMMALRRHQIQFLGAVIGGPEYKGISIEKAHAGRNISESAFAKVAAHLGAALEHFGVSADIRSQILDAVASLQGQVVGK